MDSALARRIDILAGIPRRRQMTRRSKWQIEVHAFVAVVLVWMASLMRSIAMPSRSYQTESLERLSSALGLANSTPLAERMASGRPNFLRRSRTPGKHRFPWRREVSRAMRYIAAGEVGDG
jgi:hypothetical protein